MNSIFEAIVKNDVSTVEQLLQTNPDVHKSITEFEDTPLHKAVHFDCSEIVTVLIQAGADVNAIGDLGKTPLHYAAEQEHPTTLAKILIENRANVEKTNKHRETPLMIAAWQNPEVAEFLIESGAYVDLSSAVMLRRPDRVKGLLDKDPHLRDVTFPNQLIWQAVQVNSQEILGILLAHGLKPSTNALFAAIQLVLNGYADFELLEMVVNGGADVYAKQFGAGWGKSPLEFAKAFESPMVKKVVRLLKKHGATD